MLLRRSEVLAILLTSIVSGAAQAHPALQSTNPGQGATVSSPTEIRLTFSEDLIAKFSGLTVKDEGGRAIETGGPTVDPNQKRQLIVPIAKPLPAGTYNVDWHAVSADTHRVNGHFSFRVAQ